MSGVFATLEFASSHTPVIEQLERQTRAGSHLGPDGSHWITHGPVGLGHCHFWTTPEEVGERQPICDVNRRFFLTADIRLDNREELMGRLRERDSGIGTDASDARLLLACYAQWGAETFGMLVGEFAVVLWDSHRQVLICARDPIGFRSLVCFSDHHRFVCASSIRQLLVEPGVPRILSESTVAQYLAGYHPNPDDTFYEGIHRLPSGCTLEVGLGGSAQIRRYWDVQSFSENRSGSLDDDAQSFRQHFLRAVRAHLRSVPTTIGLTVSGGVDSACVATAAHHINAENGLRFQFHGFSNVATIPPADERTYLDALINRLQLPVELTQSESHWAWRPVPGFTDRRDEPFEAPYLSRVAHDMSKAQAASIQVMLCGSGGDEVGGSSWYLIDLIMRGELLRFLPEFRARARGKGVGRFGLLRSLVRAWFRMVHTRFCDRPSAVAPQWMTPCLTRQLQPPRVEMNDALFNPASQGAREQVKAWLNNPRLSATRPFHTQFRVEMRYPFLDRRVVEWALSVPPYRFGQNGLLKSPQRRALVDLLPPAIAQRADKGNYLYYWDLGLRERERPRILEMLKKPVAEELGFVDAAKLRAAYEQYCQGQSINRSQLWNVLTLEAWLRNRAVT